MIGVGDLVVCVKRGEWRGEQTGRIISGPIYGATYTVAWVGLSRTGNPSLELEGVETFRNPNGTLAPWRADRFRKVIRDKHEPCEPEFVELLNRSKPGVPVMVAADDLDRLMLDHGDYCRRLGDAADRAARAGHEPSLKSRPIGDHPYRGESQ